MTLPRILSSLVVMAALLSGAAAGEALSPRAAEVPFAYPAKGTRAWPLLNRALAAGETVRLTAHRDGRLVARDDAGKLTVANLAVVVDRDGRLEVAAGEGAAAGTFDVEIAIEADGETIDRQRIVLRPAPPIRPVTYYADFGDDLINIFGAGMRGSSTTPASDDPANDKWIPGRMNRGADGVARYDKAGFDQYFRRLQNQGVTHEILWLFPFPFVSDESAYVSEDWNLYQRHARALIESPDLAKMMSAPSAGSGFLHWLWLRDIMAFRLDPAAHHALAQSAMEHGITLGVSYRPFEQAASKYYELPVFDASGEFLWSFQPLSSPTVNFRGRDVGFMHYRELLAAAGKAALGEVGEIHLRNAGNRNAFLARYRSQKDNLQIVTTDFPPLQSDSFVLVRQMDGEFRLTPFQEIAEHARARRQTVRNFTVRPDDSDGIVISQLDIPRGSRYLLIENPSGAAPLTIAGDDPVRVISRAGTPLGRNAVYLSFAGDAIEEKSTRVGAITNAGRYHAVFAAAEASQKHLVATGSRQALSTSTIVIDRGEPYSREMVDFERPLARAGVVRELQAILKYPAFREIYVNTRSHTSLVTSSGDGEDGVQPTVHYLATKKKYTRLGIDLAYAPRSALDDPDLRTKLNAANVVALTEFHPGEWSGQCQSSERNEPWRLARNRGVAQGVRLLLQDLETAFPSTRVRVVIPEGEAVTQHVATLAAKLPPAAVPYTRSRNNYIQNIGEGMTLLNLTGLRTEPVLLGIGPFVDEQILQTYLDAALPELATNRGSTFRGARGIMYEGQWTLKTEEGRHARESVMRALLARRGEIGEVIVYEAADWAYRLPYDGFDFLDPRPAR